jgi:hypothetical protein
MFSSRIRCPKISELKALIFPLSSAVPHGHSIGEKKSELNLKKNGRLKENDFLRKNQQ